MACDELSKLDLSVRLFVGRLGVRALVTCEWCVSVEHVLQLPPKQEVADPDAGVLGEA